ncbi:MAG TPA: fused MFS/spermidine synthase [Solirubrobacteraceae bacterium]|nr:fused MFS/spermidine synthase [Solirubrobacteraceae bacterium]
MARRRAADTVLHRDGELIVERDPARATGRLLIQQEMESSYVDLADPTHLEFDYMRWLRIILRAARARRIVHVGGGACALPRALAAEWPDGRQEVCELDAGVLALAREHMGLRRMRGLRVRHADGREWLATEPDSSHDAVVIDAFLGARIPRRLITAEALADVARVAPLALVNVVDDRTRRTIDRVAAGLAEAYPQVFALGGRSGNTIVAGARARLPALDRIAAAAAADPSPASLTPPAALAKRLAGAAPARDPEPPSRPASGRRPRIDRPHM